MSPAGPALEGELQEDRGHVLSAWRGPQQALVLARLTPNPGRKAATGRSPEKACLAPNSVSWHVQGAGGRVKGWIPERVTEELPRVAGVRTAQRSRPRTDPADPEQ